MDDFKFESELLLDGLPTVEKFQKALQDAYERGLRQGGKKALDAIGRAFRPSEYKETEEANGKRSKNNRGRRSES